MVMAMMVAVVVVAANILVAVVIITHLIASEEQSQRRQTLHACQKDWRLLAGLMLNRPDCLYGNILCMLIYIYIYI